MTENERKRLLARMRKATKEAQTLPRETILKRLIDKGFVDGDGKLSAAYGGASANP